MYMMTLTAFIGICVFFETKRTAGLKANAAAHEIRNGSNATKRNLKNKNKAIPIPIPPPISIAWWLPGPTSWGAASRIPMTTLAISLGQRLGPSALPASWIPTRCILKVAAGTMPPATM